MTSNRTPLASGAVVRSQSAVIFRTMDIPLLDGRTFTMHDPDDTPLVVIVNESMAKQNWPGQSAIGKPMHGGNPHKPMPWATVVGVVADTKAGGRDAR